MPRCTLGEGRAPPDVRDVGAPLQVGRDGLEADEEPREEEDRDGCDRTHKRGHLAEKEEEEEKDTPSWKHMQERHGWPLKTQNSRADHLTFQSKRMRSKGPAPKASASLEPRPCAESEATATCLTCKEVDAAPIRSPRDWATKAVEVARAEKSRKRVASGGCPVIQYTMLQ